MKLTIIWFLLTILIVHLTTAISLPPEYHRLIARDRGSRGNGNGGARPGPGGAPSSFHENGGSRGRRNRATDPPPPGLPPPPLPAPPAQLDRRTHPVRRQTIPGGSGGGVGGNIPGQVMAALPTSGASSPSESNPSTPKLTEETNSVYEPVDEKVRPLRRAYAPVDGLGYDYKDASEPGLEYVDEYSPEYEPTLEFVDEYSPEYEPTLEFVDEYSPQYEPTLAFVDEYSPQYEPTVEYVNEDVAEFSPTTEYHVEYSDEYSPTFSAPDSGDDSNAKGKPVNINNNSNHIGINLDMGHYLGEENHQDHGNDHSTPGTAIAPYTPLLPDATSPNPPGKTHYPTKVHLLQEDYPHHVATDPAGGIRVQAVEGAHRIGSIISWPAFSKPHRCQLVFNMPKTGGGRVHAHALSGSAEGATWGKKPSRGKHLGTWNAGYGGTEGKWEVGTGDMTCGTPVELSWADGTDGGVWWPTNGVGVVILGAGATNMAETTNIVAATKPKKAPVRVRGPVKKVYKHA